MHLGAQTLEFLVGDQFRIARRFQRLLLERLLPAGGLIVTGNVCRTFAPCFSTSTKRSGMKPSFARQLRLI
jgi:hypothetical protein